MSEAAATTETDDGPVRFMDQLVGLDYRIVTPPVRRRFEERMQGRRITGDQCPSCGLVYVPPKGFCPLCVVETTDDDIREVADVGTVVSFTVLTPIQYRGQEERQPYVLASLLLDGANATVGQQRIAGIDTDDVRTGLRVRARWRPEGEPAGEDATGRLGLGPAIEHWEPSGEPDAAPETYQEHIL